MNFDDLKPLIEKVQANLKAMPGELLSTIEQPIDTEAGGGMVKLTIDRDGKFSKLEIDPMLLEADHVHHLEQLLMAAFNDARDKFEHALREAAMQTLTENVPADGALQDMIRTFMQPDDRDR